MKKKKVPQYMLNRLLGTTQPKVIERQIPSEVVVYVHKAMCPAFMNGLYDKMTERGLSMSEYTITNIKPIHQGEVIETCLSRKLNY